MAKTRIRISTPYPTVEYVAKTFRMPAREVKKVLSMMDEILEQREREKKAAQSPKSKSQRKRRSRP